MRTRTKVIIDWGLLGFFCLVMFFTSTTLPEVWENLPDLFQGNKEYLPMIFIVSIQLIFLGYLIFVRKQAKVSSYLWYIFFMGLLFFVYKQIPDPYDRMHLFEYFIVTYLFFKALHHHIFSQKLYFMGVIFTLSLALIDEFFQLFTFERTASLADLAADFAAATVGQLSIALIIKPKLEKWRFKLKLKRAQLSAEQQWLKKRKQK